MILERKELFNENAKRGTQSMIGGETTNIREWGRAKYDWARPLVKLMWKNTWFADEVDLTADVTQFRSLSEEERTAFNKTINFLNYLESIQCENLPRLGDYITAPEISSLLNTHAFQEEIHADSYETILQAVANPNEKESIYDEWRNDELMKKRNKFIADLYQQFSDEPNDRNFILACMANYLLEGLYFYSSFSFFYALANNGKMTGTAKMIRLIQRDENIHVKLFENIINENRKEIPELFTPNFNEELRQMTKEAVEWEVSWGKRISGDSIPGLSDTTLEKYIQWLSNDRLKRIKLDPVYPEITSNPMRWIEKWEAENTTKEDFFQTTVANYQKSSNIGIDEL